ncbi:hypothetical protein MY8738_009203 [Beauveria namnaoensis]
MEEDIKDLAARKLSEFLSLCGVTKSSQEQIKSHIETIALCVVSRLGYRAFHIVLGTQASHSGQTGPIEQIKRSHCPRNAPGKATQGKRIDHKIKDPST